MKTITTLGFISVLILGSIFTASAAVKVKGYTKSNGRYVSPTLRSSPNKTKLDNYSTKGNYNPYTGKVGKLKGY